MIYTDEMYHFGVKGMKWGIRNAETKARYARDGMSKNKNPAYKYKATGKLIAKPGLERSFGDARQPELRIIYRPRNKPDKRIEDIYTPTTVGKTWSKINRKLTKDKELSRLADEYNKAVSSSKSEISKEARKARAAFEQRGQDLAVKYIKKYRKAYTKQLGLKLNKAGKKKLEEALMNEVYLGPPTWNSKRRYIKSYAEALGVDKVVKTKRYQDGKYD